jgi:nucleoside-diphosphate-sugar epimerase
MSNLMDYKERQLDVTRARKLFGFRATTPLREGLEKTITWFSGQLEAR